MFFVPRPSTLRRSAAVKPLVIVAQRRSGTNMLQSMLKASGGFAVAHEIFLPPGRSVPRFNYWMVLDSLGEASICRWPYSRSHSQDQLRLYYEEVLRRAEGKPLVFDIKYDWMFQTLPAPGTPLVMDFFDGQQAAFLHVRRRNLLEQYVSDVRAVKTGEWVRPSASKGRSRDAGENAPIMVRIDTSGIERILKGRSRLVEEMAGLLRGVATCGTIDYEDMLQDGHASPALVSLIRELTGIEIPADVVPLLEKIALPLEEIVENYDDLRACLAGTEFDACVRA